MHLNVSQKANISDRNGQNRYMDDYFGLFLLSLSYHLLVLSVFLSFSEEYVIYVFVI